MYDIHRDLLDKFLLTTTNRVPIVMVDKYSEKRIVYLLNYSNNSWWVTDNFGNKFRLSGVQSVGGKVVQSRQSYKEEKDAYYEVKKSEKRKLVMSKYKHYKQQVN
jgi:hypothetical protein